MIDFKGSENMYKIEDLITIIRDMEELERLGFKFMIKDSELMINGEFDRKIDLQLLNSYRGLIMDEGYYNNDEIIKALEYKNELREGL